MPPTRAAACCSASLAAALRWATLEAATGTRGARRRCTIAARAGSRADIESLLADPIGEPGRRAALAACSRWPRAPRRSSSEMDFRFLYDRKRKLFAIGYRLADAEGPGRLDARATTCSPPRRALASFLAIAKERRAAGALVPARPAAHQRRRRAGAALVERDDVRVPDAAPADAELPGTLLDRSCRLAVRRQIEYAASAACPGASPSRRFAVVDRSGHYQYKAFGVPGLGLKRGLGGRAGGGALRDRARRARRRQAAPRATCSASPSSGSRAATASTRRSTTRARKGDVAARRHGRGRRHRSCAPTSPTTRA